MKAKVLYLEDDVTLAYLTADSLRMHGYEVVLKEDGNAALEEFRDMKYDLCIFDVMVPGLNGVELARQIRKFDQRIPIIFPSARGLTEDRIEALRSGGDDYLVKPFRVEELILKMEVFLRRSGIVADPPQEEFKFDQLVFKPSDLCLYHKEEVTKMTSRETELLAYFWSKPNEVLKREDILRQIWGDDDYFMGRSLDVFISRLRKYLRKEPRITIENVHAVGFKFKIGQE